MKRLLWIVLVLFSALLLFPGWCGHVADRTPIGRGQLC